MKNGLIVLLTGTIISLSGCGASAPKAQRVTQEFQQSRQPSQQIDDWASNASVALTEFKKSDAMVISSINQKTSNRLDEKAFLNQLNSAKTPLEQAISNIYGAKLTSSRAIQINRELVTSFNDYYLAIKHLQQGTMLSSESVVNTALHEIGADEKEEEQAKKDFQSYMGN